MSKQHEMEQTNLHCVFRLQPENPPNTQAREVRVALRNFHTMKILDVMQIFEEKYFDVPCTYFEKRKRASGDTILSGITARKARNNAKT